MFCLEINTKIKGSKISGILFLNFHSWNCSRILENSFREFSFPGIKKSWKILSWKKIVLEFSQNNLYFPWNLQFWNFPFLEFSTPGILSWNFLFLESYFTEFSCYPLLDALLKRLSRFLLSAWFLSATRAAEFFHSKILEWMDCPFHLSTLWRGYFTWARSKA